MSNASAKMLLGVLTRTFHEVLPQKQEKGNTKPSSFRRNSSPNKFEEPSSRIIPIANGSDSTSPVDHQLGSQQLQFSINAPSSKSNNPITVTISNFKQFDSLHRFQEKTKPFTSQQLSNASFRQKFLSTSKQLKRQRDQHNSSLQMDHRIPTIYRLTGTATAKGAFSVPKIKPYRSDSLNRIQPSEETKLNIEAPKSQQRPKMFSFESPSPTKKQSLIIRAKQRLMKARQLSRGQSSKMRINLVDIQDSINENQLDFKRTIGKQLIKLAQENLMPLVGRSFEGRLILKNKFKKDKQIFQELRKLNPKLANRKRIKTFA